ncbi:MAG: hypothetical protein FVQ85_02885 [Planctomycetes bacterium]|nr:hypothetical protein [Planctomycetota bacterium]
MNLVRRSVLKHPSGLEIKTPMLIPSFSSKGCIFPKSIPKPKECEYPFFQTETKLSEKNNPTTGKISEVTVFLIESIDTLTDSMLVSAYDIFHKHIPIPYQNNTPDITFLDSGGYEVGDTFDYSTIIRSTVIDNEWKREYYIEVLGSWPDYVPAVFISFDHQGESVDKQIELAKQLFSRFRGKQLCAFLIKPVSDEQTFRKTLNGIRENINKFKDFDIVGIADKDIGNSVSMVMENIAKIRLAMDDAKVDAPLHIFGSLDPLTSWLYYLSGAELFDGLSWLRYGYFEGRTLYYRNNGILSLGINKEDDFIRAQSMKHNLYYLMDLQLEMEQFALDHDYDKIQFNGNFLKDAYEKLCKIIKKEI